MCAKKYLRHVQIKLDSERRLTLMVVPNRGCREEVSGVPPNIEFTTFLIFFTAKGAPNCHYSRVRVPPNFFQSYRVP